MSGLTRYVVVITGIVAVAATAGCEAFSGPKHPHKRAGQATEARDERPLRGKSDYERDARRQLDDLSKAIDGLAATAADASTDAGRRLQLHLRRAAEERAAARRKLDQLGAVTGESWRSVKESVDGAMTRLREAYRDAARDARGQ